jgi:Cu2+-exporting ATPase
MAVKQYGATFKVKPKRVDAMQHEPQRHEMHASPAMHKLALRFFVSVALTIPILLMPFTFGAPVLAPAVSFLCATLIIFYGGMPFFVGFTHEIKHKQPGMMSLIVLALSVAYGYSLLVMIGLLEGMSFFAEVATLVDVMLLGHLIEMRLTLRATSLASTLARLIPVYAHRMHSAKDIEDVKVSELKVGDTILIREGEAIARDGVVVSGESEVNESVLTGEAAPRVKKKGDTVIGGSINGTGSLVIQITKNEHETYLARVTHMVMQALYSKSRFEGLADRAAYVLTLGVFACALLTFFGSFYIFDLPLALAVERMVSVLVVACPHALALAGPLVMISVLSSATFKGFIIRNKTAFEAAHDLDVIIFDKTGILTQGVFSVTDVVSLGEWDEKEVLGKAASLEIQSAHGLAQSIAAHAAEQGVKMFRVEGVKTMPGKGVYATLEGHMLYVGNMRLFETVEFESGEGKESLIAAKRAAKRVALEGKTVVFVASSDKVEGFIALSDTMRPEALAACTRLKKQGYEVALMTGDNRHTAGAVAQKLGIDLVLSEVLPNKKVAHIKKLQQEGKKVAMVGDGINDAPALAQADVGIAIGAGAPAAREFADITLVHNDPRDVAVLIQLSKIARRKMIQNVVWAAGYNIIALPLAAGLFASQGVELSPALSACMMSLSTVIVVVNSRLIRFRKK